MKVLLVEPFYGGSHRKWADGFKAYSTHEVRLLTLPAAHWKWRMHGAAVTLSEKANSSDFIPDLILATDMLDVATFKASLKTVLRDVPMVTYFHENQITYPWSRSDKDLKLKRDNHYGFINYTSALVSDKVLFNSEYHLNSFIEGLSQFLKQFPDYQNLETIQRIQEKSEVVHLGMNLMTLDSLRPAELQLPKRATILWNHRWEYDKNPEEFFESLIEIKRRSWEFNLVVLGERFKKQPAIFESAKQELNNNILHWGFVESRAEYAHWLWHSDILPVTSNQDFFGGSIVEAMYCNVKPLLPKRLAYPEHVPANLHHVFFYDDGKLTSRLQNWIKDVTVLRKQQTRSFVEKYDWSKVALLLDQTLNLSGED